MSNDQMFRGRCHATPYIYITGTRQVLTNVHDPSACEDRPCVIHSPSRHPLVNAPTHWRMGDNWLGQRFATGEIMERICPCGVFHPDPDDIAFIASTFPIRAEALLEHSCCGCCGEDI